MPGLQGCPEVRLLSSLSQLRLPPHWQCPRCLRVHSDGSSSSLSRPAPDPLRTRTCLLPPPFLPRSHPPHLSLGHTPSPTPTHVQGNKTVHGPRPTQSTWTESRGAEVLHGGAVMRTGVVGRRRAAQAEDPLRGLHSIAQARELVLTRLACPGAPHCPTGCWREGTGET